MNVGSLFIDLVTSGHSDRNCGPTMIRNDLLRACRAAGATMIKAQYDGYGDSGNVEDIVFIPTKLVAVGATETRLADFLWQMAYDRHPGFENNEGGYGEICWDLEADTISLDHADRYVEVNHTYSEGL